MKIDIGEVLSRAWQITWKHKMLWLFGFIQTLAGFLFVPVAIIPAFAPLVSESFRDWTAQPWFILIFMGGFFIFLLLTYPISVIMNGALSIGVLRAEKGEDKLSFTELIRASFPYFWRLLGLILLFVGGMMLIMLAFLALQMILTIVTFGLAAMCMTPLSLLTYPLTFIWYICMEQSMAAIVIDEMGVMDAARRGWQIFRSNMLSVALIGLVLYFGIGMISGLIMMPILVPFFAMSFAIEMEEFRNVIFLIAGVCGVIFIPIVAIFQGGVFALMKSGWILTYLRLTRPTESQPVLQETTV